ncbi:MAG: hypothetical protein RQ750_05510 [Roseovarius sp.]|nr:hypothetical protein [Roseovarius sp.]
MQGNASGKTVLIASAGCAAGLTLAGGFARAGAGVIAIDHDEDRNTALARMNPSRIETLRLDVLRPRQCRDLGDIWQDTPIDLLIHLQALRDPTRLGAAITSIPVLTRALAPGLRRGRGKVLIVYDTASADASAETLAYRSALTDLAPLMQAEMGAPFAINALRLHKSDPILPQARRAAGALLMAAMYLDRTGAGGGLWLGSDGLRAPRVMRD